MSKSDEPGSGKNILIMLINQHPMLILRLNGAVSGNPGLLAINLMRRSTCLQIANSQRAFYAVYSLQTTGLNMHVVSREPFDEAARKYPNDAAALDAVYRMLKTGKFDCPDELKRFYKSLDRFRYKDKWWVLDVGGHNLRIIFYANFKAAKTFIEYIATHAEYDKLTAHYRSDQDK